MALYRMVQSMEVFPSVVGPLVREVQRMVVYRIPLAQDQRMVVFPSVVEVGMEVRNEYNDELLMNYQTVVVEDKKLFQVRIHTFPFLRTFASFS